MSVAAVSVSTKTIDIVDSSMQTVKAKGNKDLGNNSENL